MVPPELVRRRLWRYLDPRELNVGLVATALNLNVNVFKGHTQVEVRRRSV
jgi:hypothetical protein